MGQLGPLGQWDNWSNGGNGAIGAIGQLGQWGNGLLPCISPISPLHLPRFVLATYVHAYPNNICSVWVYVASLEDMRAGATASVG